MPGFQCSWGPHGIYSVYSGKMRERERQETERDGKESERGCGKEVMGTETFARQSIL